MTQQGQSPKIQAKVIAAKEHVSPLPHRQGLAVQVKIQSPKKQPTDLERRFQEMQQELLALKAEKSMMIDKGLSSTFDGCITSSPRSYTSDNPVIAARWNVKQRHREGR